MGVIWLPCRLPAVAFLLKVIPDIGMLPDNSAPVQTGFKNMDKVAGAWAFSLLRAAASAQTPLHILSVLIDTRATSICVKLQRCANVACADMPETVHKVATEMKRLHAALMRAVLIGVSALSSALPRAPVKPARDMVLAVPA